MESAEGDPGDGQSSGFWDRRKGPWQRGLGPGGVWTGIRMPSMWPEFRNSPSSFSLSLPAAPKGLCFPNVDVEAGNQQVPSPGPMAGLATHFAQHGCLEPGDACEWQWKCPLHWPGTSPFPPKAPASSTQRARAVTRPGACRRVALLWWPQPPCRILPWSSRREHGPDGTSILNYLVFRPLREHVSVVLSRPVRCLVLVALGDEDGTEAQSPPPSTPSQGRHPERACIRV